ncbi:MAG: hypothetical protein Kow0068_01230 [Marinilabiliales bacterium]
MMNLKLNIMKSSLLIFMSLFLISLSGFSQKGVVNNGVKIAISSGAVMKITGSDGNYTNNTSGSTHGRIDLDGKIRIEGDWVNNATSGNVLINVDNDGEVIFQGATTQYIQGNQTEFEKLTLNNASGLTLQSSTLVNGDFTFTSGRINLGSYNLTLGSGSSIVGTPSSSKMFVATGTGQVRKIFSAPGSFTFPVGDMTGTYEYSPITLDFTSGTFGSSAYAGVRLSDAKHPNNNALTSFISRYWSVSQSNISGFSCDISATYLTADVNGTESDMFTGKWNSPNWLKLNAVNTTTNQISGTVTSFGDFTAGAQDMFCSPAIVLGSTVTDVTCNGGNDGAIDLSVTNGLSPYTYDWATSDGSGLTPGVEDQTGLSQGTYNVTVTDINGCTATDAISITYLNDPVANAGADDDLCPGQTTVQLNASGGITYAWSPSTGLSDPNIANPVANPSSTTTYTVTVTDAAGCTDTDDVVVTINSLPVADAGADQTICNGESTTITASGGGTYQWDNGLGAGATHTVSPTTTTTYTVTVTNTYGCTDTDNMTITVNDLPVVDAGTDQSIPNGTTTTLDATVSGGSGTYIYSWSPADSLVNASIEDPTTVNLYSTNVFTLTVTDATTGCQATDNVTVTVTGGPLNANVVAVPDTICEGETVQLYSQASGGTGTYSYSWTSNPTGFTSSIADPTINPIVNTTYILTLDDGSNTVIDSVNVFVNPLPVVDLGADTTLCPDDTITLSAGTGYDSYLWSTNDTTPTLTIDSSMVGLATVTYFVTVTDNGCETFDQISITYDVCSNIEFSAGDLIISLYPNPSKGLVFINYQGLTEPIDINVLDMSGKSVVYKKVESNEANFVQKLDLTNLAKGSYIVKFTNKDFVHLERLILY